MSNVATDWAWKADLPPNLKLVLLALAHCHNGKTGQCNPRVKTLADMVGKKHRTVRYDLKALQEAGYIKPAKRRKGARQASNHYALALDGVAFQTREKRTRKVPEKASKYDAQLHSENTLSCTLYTEQESEKERTQPSNVVAFDKSRRAENG